MRVERFSFLNSSGRKPKFSDDQTVVETRRDEFRYRRRLGVYRQDSLPLVEEASQAPARNCRQLVVLGARQVGKTAIVNRFLHNTFDPMHRPDVDCHYRKVYRIKGETYRLDVLDTSSVTQNPAQRRIPFITGKKLNWTFLIWNKNLSHSWAPAGDGRGSREPHDSANFLF